MLWPILAVLLLLFASAADAVRDAWFRHAWWKRHVAKWLAFYPPLLWILVREVPWPGWLPVLLLAWVAWRLSARYIGGVRWPTFWSRLFSTGGPA